MRRRKFIMLGRGAVAGLFTTALRATAQQTAKIPRVGILSPARARRLRRLLLFARECAISVMSRRRRRRERRAAMMILKAWLLLLIVAVFL
jgi:uncharacterized membrane protein